MRKEILHDLGFFGHYLHVHTGGRGGKQFVLVTLDASGGQLTQRELLERSNTSPAALSEVLAKLEAEGLILREPCESDRRQLTIELTKEGSVLAGRLRQERETFECEAFSCLTGSEQAQLKELLDKLAEHWRSMEGREVRV